MNLNDQLWDAARRGDDETVTTLLARGADVNDVDVYEGTALHCAARRGQWWGLRYLYTEG